MKPQIEKPDPPQGAKLFATADPNNSHHKRLEVYDDAGIAFIIRQLPTSKWISWHCVERSPMWFINNNQPRCGWEMELVS